MVILGGGRFGGGAAFFWIRAHWLAWILFTPPILVPSAKFCPSHADNTPLPVKCPPILWKLCWNFDQRRGDFFRRGNQIGGGAQNSAGAPDFIFLGSEPTRRVPRVGKIPPPNLFSDRILSPPAGGVNPSPIMMKLDMVTLSRLTKMGKLFYLFV